MKTMKRFLAAAMAVTSVMAIAPMSAFAENETGGSTNVTFDAPRNSPEFTITIPASVNLNAENPTATIEAEGVYLDTSKHKQINVTLDSAQYVETGASTFIAKTADGNSSVTYTIGKDTATTGVKVGDTGAEFTADSSVTLNFSEPTGATYAGTHTETLTFGISVEDAAYTPQTYNTLSSGDVLKPGDTIDSNTEYNFYGLGMSLTIYYTWTLVRADVTAGAEWFENPTVTEKDDGAYYVIKGVDRDNGSTFYMVNTSPEGNLEGMIFSVTDTSDGVVLTQSGSSWTMAVHEP